MGRSNLETYRDYGLVFCALGSEIIAFALYLSTLVGPVPNFSAGSSLLHLVNTATNASVTDVWTGPLGSCYRLANGAAICSTPSLTPSYNVSYDASQIPDTLRKQLVISMSDLPGILLFVISVMSLAIGLSSFVCLPRVSPHLATGRYQANVPRINKVAMVLTAIVLAFGMTVAACLHIETERCAEGFNKWSDALGSTWEAHMQGGLAQAWVAVAFTILGILGHLGLALNMPIAQIKLGAFQWA